MVQIVGGARGRGFDKINGRGLHFNYISIQAFELVFRLKANVFVKRVHCTCITCVCKVLASTHKHIGLQHPPSEHSCGCLCRCGGSQLVCPRCPCKGGCRERSHQFPGRRRPEYGGWHLQSGGEGGEGGRGEGRREFKHLLIYGSAGTIFSSACRVQVLIEGRGLIEEIR